MDPKHRSITSCSCWCCRRRRRHAGGIHDVWRRVSRWPAGVPTAAARTLSLIFEVALQQQAARMPLAQSASAPAPCCCQCFLLPVKHSRVLPCTALFCQQTRREIQVFSTQSLLSPSAGVPEAGQRNVCRGAGRLRLRAHCCVCRRVPGGALRRPQHAIGQPIHQKSPTRRECLQQLPPAHASCITSIELPLGQCRQRATGLILAEPNCSAGAACNICLTPN